MRDVFRRIKRILATLICLTVAPFAHGQSFLTNGLVAYYPFNGNANDASGNGINGNPGTAQLAPDRFGVPQSAYFFNGTNSFISFVRSPTTNVENVSMFCWLRPTVLPQFAGVVMLAFCNPVAQTGGYGLGIGNAPGLVGNHLLEQINCETWVDGSFTFESLNTWHHVGLVRQNGNDYFYADGQLVTVQQGPTPTPSRVFWIGALAYSPPLFFNGYIDDVRVYGRALTSTEVQQLYAYEAAPNVELIKAVKPSFSNLIIGVDYQLQSSADLSTWTNQTSLFTATSNNMVYPQYFDIDNWGELFFRLQIVP